MIDILHSGPASVGETPIADPVAAFRCRLLDAVRHFARPNVLSAAGALLREFGDCARVELRDAAVDFDRGRLDSLLERAGVPHEFQTEMEGV